MSTLCMCIIPAPTNMYLSQPNVQMTRGKPEFKKNPTGTGNTNVRDISTIYINNTGAKQLKLRDIPRLWKLTKPVTDILLFLFSVSLLGTFGWCDCCSYCHCMVAQNNWPSFSVSTTQADRCWVLWRAVWSHFEFLLRLCMLRVCLPGVGGVIHKQRGYLSRVAFA